jgi:hypothetical protein
LVAASALLDLVSEKWLAQLIRRCARAAAAVWFALIYDGMIACDPEEPEDATVRGLLNAHQQTDKGFGPALGPVAAQKAAYILAKTGYDTRCEPSYWRLKPDQQKIQHMLLDSWFDAARDIAPETTLELKDWRQRRRAHIASGRSRMIVGHIDVVGWPESRFASPPE